MKHNKIEIVARIISSVFSPLMMPTYGVALALNMTYLQAISQGTRIGIIAIILLLTAIIPAVVIRSLSTLSIVKDAALTDRTDRPIPYIVTLLLYISTTIYLYIANAPTWLYGFLIGASVALAITIVVNHWWKISAHGTASGGIVALAAVIATLPSTPQPLTWLVIATIIVAGMVGTARLLLNRHTPLQVYSGFANGFLNVLLWSLI